MSVEIRVPTLGESITEATIAKWLKKQGDAVAIDEPLVELETDKVTLEVNSPANGVLSKVALGEGEDVEVGAVLGVVEEGEAPSASSSEDASSSQGDASEKSEAPAEGESGSSSAEAGAGPAARKLAEEKGIDLADVTGSGPKGNVTKADVRDAASAASGSASASAAAPAPEAREERVRMTRLRKSIASRLKEAQNTAAMLTTFNEVDLSAVMAMRKRYQDRFVERHGVKLGFMSFFVKASIEALKAYPAVNAEIDGDDIVYKHYYDIGVAVSAPSGLVVPILRGADAMSLAEIEKGIGELGNKARDGALSMAEMSGGTFTISNGGVFGSMLSTPILNPPQVGILGMHNIVQRPVVTESGAIEARPIMYLALSYDHRIIDGREAVSFLVRVKECVEAPERMLIDA